VTLNSGDVDRFDSLDVAEKKANLDTLSAFESALEWMTEHQAAFGDYWPSLPTSQI